MKIYSGVFMLSMMLSLLCCNNNSTEENPQERHLECNDLRLVRLDVPNEMTIGDTIVGRVHNTCKSCVQAVYTGLIIYSDEGDTLAMDTQISVRRTPEDGKSFDYEMEILKSFELNEI
jgi:hypothetical protein